MAQLVVSRRPETRYCSAAQSAAPGAGTGPDRAETLDRLYRRERPKLLAFLACRVGAEQAKDLVQEVFVRAAMSKQLMALHNPYGYLLRIARNLLIDEARRQDCRIRLLPLFDGCDAAHGGEQEKHLHAEEASELFELAMSQLPEKTARIFTMSRFEHRTYREIHQELGIALATVDYHMMKALAHLREKLDDCL